MLKRWAAWPQGIRWPAVIAAVVLGLAFVLLLFVPIADWLAHLDVGSVKGSLYETAVDNARGRLLTLFAGVFAAGALIFTARNFTLSRRSFELTEQGQVTDRYAKAIEQLGSDKLDVRIGGIYALGRVARDSVRDHSTVMEVLTAFIREHSREPWPPQVHGQERERSIRPDVQAALTVISRRAAKHDIEHIDLTRAHLRRAQLRSANLDSADLPATDLTGADLIAANFTCANLTGANLTRANLDSARLPSADLTDANLTDADLGGADLTYANLTGADLTDAYIGGADLTDANLARAKWPEGAAVPKGWKLDTGSGLLRPEPQPRLRPKAAGPDSRPAQTN